MKNILSGLHPIIGEKISIRVNSIDTPEINGKCEKEKYDAQQAKEIDALRGLNIDELKTMYEAKQLFKGTISIGKKG